MEQAVAIDGGLSDDWMKCTKCPTYVDTYIPLPHQALIHSDPSRAIGIFGGFGSGKTKTDVKDQEKAIFITPNGRSLVGAEIMPQIEQTFKLDFERDCPIDFVRHINKQKNYIDFTNGHRLLYRPFYDPEIFKSLNLTHIRMIEASGCSFDVFTQLQTRLRNSAAIKYQCDANGEVIFDDDGNPIIEADWRKIVVESNPDAGWIRSEFLLRSNYIFLHHKDSHEQEYYVDPSKVDPFRSSHIIPTRANTYLPPNFVEEISVGKPLWWRNRYLSGSFDYSEGLVYPEALRAIIKPVEIKKSWKHLIAMDYGINDKTVFLFGAIDSENHILYIYHEIVLSDMNIKSLATAYRKDLERFIPLGGLYRTPVMDKISMNKRSAEHTDKTIGSLFLDEGLLFEGAKMNLQARIMRTNTLIETGQLKIFATCKYLISEILEYKFPEKTLGNDKSQDKPEDKNNHAVNALEFMVMEVPHDLKLIEFTAFDEFGRPIVPKAYLGKPKYEKEERRQYYDPFSTSEVQSNPFYESIYGRY